MADGLLYHEQLSSSRTMALFLALTLIFCLLTAWRTSAHSLDALAIIFACFAGIFLFYSVNYRTLIIRITPAGLGLRFGIFQWRVPIGNIESCQLDEVPAFKRLGGAGIHFMTVRGRYRASFNFLEYPRVVIAFKSKAGPVQDISFSTRRPDEVLETLQRVVVAGRQA